MSRKSEYAEFKNEIKTTLTDRAYKGLKAYMALNGIRSDADGVRRLAELQLFGAVGNLPANLIDDSEALGQTRTLAAA